MNISDDIVNDSHLMYRVIINNKFKKLTWSYHKIGTNEIIKCHDDSSNIISLKFSDYEGTPRFYFYAKKYIDKVKVNFILKNGILADTIFLSVFVEHISWLQYQFDDEFKFEIYE